MSQFTFPRINFNGSATINVGTGNNDDYSGYVRTSDSINVQPIMNGNTTDEEFMNWATTLHTFTDKDDDTKQVTITPGEWNFFGDMSIFLSDNAKVTGVQTDYNKLITEESQNSLIGSQVVMYPMLMADINPEGVTNSQIFCDNFAIKNGSTTILSGKPTKSSTRFINFQRNVDLSASTGASASFYSVIPLDEVDSSSTLLTDESIKNMPGLKGFMIRYNLYRYITQIEDYEDIAKLYDGYATKELKDLLNPKVGLIVGTVSPWLDGEMKSIILGRYIKPKDSFPNPNYPNSGNGPDFVLGPVTAKVSGDCKYVSLDIVNTFTNTYDSATEKTDMYDIGNISLYLNDGTNNNPVSVINYKDYDFYLNSGGLVDLSLDGFTEEQINNGSFNVISDKYPDETLMEESDYMVASDQPTSYADQNDPEGKYNAYGILEPVTFQAVYKGQPVTQNTAVNYNLYEYAMVPNNDQKYTGYSQKISFPGENGQSVPVNLKTADRGVFLYLLCEEGVDPPTAADMDQESGFYINIRVLPTDDYSKYLQNPDLLTWDVLYANVLQYYRLIFPGMNKVFPFQEKYWSNSAAMITERVGFDWWNRVEYMPRTRDLSNSRRELIKAWLSKYMPKL